MTLKEFEENTREILHEYRDFLTKAFFEADPGQNSAVLIMLDEKHETGKTIETNFYVTSPTYNEPLYKAIPNVIKKRMYENENHVYVIFIGANDKVTSYVLLKDHFKS